MPIKTKHLPPPREVPVELRKAIYLDWHRAFSRKERLQIALGYNISIRVRVACQHSAGVIKPLIEIKTTKELLPEAKGTA